MTEIEPELMSALLNDGYLFVREIPERGICGLMPMLYTVGVCYGLQRDWYDGRFCYESAVEAKTALEQWDGKDDPPGNWIKHKGKGGERHGPGCRCYFCKQKNDHD